MWVAVVGVGVPVVHGPGYGVGSRGGHLSIAVARGGIGLGCGGLGTLIRPGGTPAGMTAGPGGVPEDRTRVLESVASSSFDVVVIGGGIAGAGVARDAAMRGLRTVVFEQHDFGWGTTAGSTRLIHGGLRYLEHGEFGLVFEGLQERETLARIASHLVEPLSFVIPVYDEGWVSRLKLRAGMILYDVLSYNKTVPWHERLSAAEVREREPGLPPAGLSGGFVYHDRKVEFVERLCLETVMDAANWGAVVVNHAVVTGVRVEDGRVVGVRVRDGLTGRVVEVASEVVVNAAGPWVDDVVGEHAGMGLVRATKGVHLVVGRLTEHALTLPTTDGRVVFVVPWNGLSLVGTTDTDYAGDPGEAAADAADVGYLLREVGRYFPELGPEDVLYTYAGVRPLYATGGGRAASAVSRRHRVVDHGERVLGLFSVVGAKITAYRRAAEDVVDAVSGYLGVGGPCRTGRTLLPGARGEPGSCEVLPEAVVEHVVGLYGARANAVFERVERDEELGVRLCPHTDDVLGQVTVAVEEEYARRVVDVMFRRCTVGYAMCEGRDAVEEVASHMAGLLGWDAARVEKEIDRYEAVLGRRHAFERDA